MNYSSAAEAGQPVAMLRLASMYERGLATANNKPDLARALAYADLAVDYSNNADLAVKFRDELKKKMKTEEISEAKKIYDSKKESMPKANPAAAAAPAAGAAPAPATAPASSGTPKAKGRK
jgi:hypothetical protein